MPAAEDRRGDTAETLTVVLVSTGETVTLNRRKALGMLSLQRATLPEAPEQESPEPAAEQEGHRQEGGEEVVTRDHLFTMSATGRSAVQDRALPGNKPASGASRGGRS